MKRSELREHLFLMLFRKDFHPEEDMKEQALMYLEALENPSEKDRIFLENRLDSVLEKIDSIDEKIQSVSVGWKITRMGKVELTIIRLAAFEILYDEEVPTGVAINEAVELAKKYGEDNSGSFVNGILAKIAE